MSRRLDALVATRVMGWREIEVTVWGNANLAEAYPGQIPSRPCTAKSPDNEWDGSNPRKRVSRDYPCGDAWWEPTLRIAQAFEVQAEMQRRGYWMELHSPHLCDSWFATLGVLPPVGYADDATAMEAICVGALYACGVSVAEIEEARKETS